MLSRASTQTRSKWRFAAHLLLVLFCLFFPAAALADVAAPSAFAATSEASAGEATAAKASAGEASAGNGTVGEATVDERAADEPTSREAQGRSAADQTAANQVDPVAQPALMSVHDANAEAEGDSARGAGLTLSELPEGFRSYDAGWLKVSYHPSLSDKVQRLIAEAEPMRADLRALMGGHVLERVEMRVGRTPFEMEALGPIGVRLPSYAAGVAFSDVGLVLLTALPRFPGNTHDLSEILKHELSHVALHDAVGGQDVPRWFNEGLAVYASGEAEMDRAGALWTATLTKKLIPLARLSRGFPSDPTEASVAYAQSADLVRYLLAGGEEHRFLALLSRVREGQAFDAALGDAYSTDLFSLETEWQEDVARRYTFWPVLLGGSTIWVFAFGLVIVAYYRRRGRDRVKLSRWAREERAEDSRRALAQALLSQYGPVRVVLGHEGPGAARRMEQKPEGDESSGRPVHSISGGQAPGTDGPRGGPVTPGVVVPKVEHEGDWHTLH